MISSQLVVDDGLIGEKGSTALKWTSDLLHIDEKIRLDVPIKVPHHGCINARHTRNTVSCKHATTVPDFNLTISSCRVWKPSAC